jgi:hypothetical protein
MARKRSPRKPPKPKPPRIPPGGFGGSALEGADLAAILEAERLDVPDDPIAAAEVPGPADDPPAPRPSRWPPGLFDEPDDELPGGLSTSSPRDDRLVARALSAGWSIPSSWMPALMRRQAQIAARGKARDATRAFVALTQATRIDAQVAIQIVNAQRAAAAEGVELMPVDATVSAPRAILYLPDNGRDAERQAS